MSFLTPVKVPVKVYLSTDKDAPKLDRTAGCVATILKACLVTGYGDKQGAGWSLAFEDNSKGVKVLKPADSPHAPFLVRLSADTGQEMTVQVYSEMTSVDDGNLILNNLRAWLYSRYYYDASGRWCVVACDRGFWLLVEAGRDNIQKQGVFLYCGDTAQNTRGERAVVIVQHSDYGLVSENYDLQAVIFNKTSATARPSSYFNGITNHSTHTLLSPTFIAHDGELFGLPVFMPSTTKAENYQTLSAQGRNFICHGQLLYGSDSNVFVPTDYWEF